jgi:hypothetical protein
LFQAGDSEREMQHPPVESMNQLLEGLQVAILSCLYQPLLIRCVHGSTTSGF